MAKRYSASSLLVFLCFTLCAAPAWAQWVKDGVLVCGADYGQFAARIVPDGAGGAIIVWTDDRNGADTDIYGTRIDLDGNVLVCGIPLCTAPGYQQGPAVIPDGTGGGIVAWNDDRDYSGSHYIYAQRGDGNGNMLWPVDGLPICTSPGPHDSPRIVPDGAGGAIIAWGDGRRGQWDIWAQRVNGDGDTLWAANGIPVDTTLGDQYTPEMVSDGSGGAILIWRDTRNGDEDLYAQRIDGDGSLLWGTGVPVCLVSGGPWDVQLMAASDGGVIATWVDIRGGWSGIYLQKVDQNGVPLWTTDGTAICDNYWNVHRPGFADDGSGGAIVVWYDERNYWEVYAQRIASDGSFAWMQGGKKIFDFGGDTSPRIMADGSGGAIVVLDKFPDDESPSDIVAQRLDHDGNLLWGAQGAGVCLAENAQYGPALAPDGFGGAIFVWEDYRVDNNNSDLFCQRVGAWGLWGDPAPEILSCLDLPADQGGWVRIAAKASSLDAPGDALAIFGYNVWREIAPSGGPLAASAPKTSLADRPKLLALLSDPAKAVGVRAGGPLAASLGLPEGDWEAVGFWFATRDTLYRIAVPTKNDSTEAGIPYETFIVTAHSVTPGVFVASEPVSGYSVDNLAPGLTAGLEGSETVSPHGLALTWTANGAPDVWKYDVHRGDNDLFAPDESNRIGSAEGTYLFDAEWVKIYQYFYKLVAVDRHGNRSPAALLRPEDINVGTTLQSFAASLSGTAVEISWTLASIDEAAAFHALRSTGGNAFAELPSAEIARSGASFSFRDEMLEPGTTYRYRVEIAEAAGRRTLFETDAIATPAMPLTLHQNHPNPFNPSTTIAYYLPAAATVTLDVYDSSGKLVARLLDRAPQLKGTHSVEWRGTDARGNAASSGVYFYRLASGRETLSRKMILVR